jgi:hypothetical protein
VLEQAAQCLLHTSPPHVRKYAFHMVLSGLRYNSCGQQQLGMRAYRCGRVHTAHDNETLHRRSSAWPAADSFLSLTLTPTLPWILNQSVLKPRPEPGSL